MDPTTVLLILVSGLGCSVAGLGAVVVTGNRSARKRQRLADAREAAIVAARWEARTVPLHDELMRVSVVRVAQLGDDRWVIQSHDSYVDVPVNDTEGLINAQVDAQAAARAANGEGP